KLTGHAPELGQYLTVVSSAAPELLEIRGRELVDRIAGQVTERLGEAEGLWSRVSREPEATVAVRPGLTLPDSGRDGVALAGAWRAAPWPPTMESAVRSGRAAARMLSEVATNVAGGGGALDADPKAAGVLPVQPSKPGGWRRTDRNERASRVTVAPDRSRTSLDTAVERATSRLLELQHPDGWWVGELESNATMIAQHLFWHHFLGLRTP